MMPVDLIAFTADSRVQGAIPLADDRLSDMLNSVARVVVRSARIDDLVADRPTETSDVTLRRLDLRRPRRRPARPRRPPPPH